MTFYTSRPRAALFVLLSPVVAFCAFFMVLGKIAFDGLREFFVAIWEMVTDEVPSFFTEDVADAFRFGIASPILAAIAAAPVAFATYRGLVRGRWHEVRSDALWAYSEAKCFVSDEGLKPSRRWLIEALKATGSSALRLLKTVFGR